MRSADSHLQTDACKPKMRKSSSVIGGTTSPGSCISDSEEETRRFEDYSYIEATGAQSDDGMLSLVASLDTKPVDGRLMPLMVNLL